MRFLVVRPGPGFSVQDVQAGWVEALRNAGQHVVDFNTDDRLAFWAAALVPTREEGKFRAALSSTEEIIANAVEGVYGAVMKTRPHVMIVVSAFFTPPQMLEVIRAAGVKVVLIHTESPYEDKRQLAIAKYADLNIINDPTNLESFKQLGPAEYFPHAYRPSVHHPGTIEPAYVCDLGFVGTGFPSRLEFFEKMAPGLVGLDVKLAGNWTLIEEGSPLAPYVIDDGRDGGFDNENTAALYRSARVGLNIYRREAHEQDSAEGWAMGPREIEQAACGLPFVRDPRPESDELFGGILPTFSSPEEATEQIRWLLKHDGYRQVAIDKARSAIADRTFDNAAKRLLRLLDKGVNRGS